MNIMFVEGVFAKPFCAAAKEINFVT